MRIQSPWAWMATGAMVLALAWRTLHIAYAPPDSTVLHPVVGSISNISTGWIYHSYRRSYWDAPILTIVMADGATIHFTAHSKNESPAVMSLATLPHDVSVHAMVDADGEIWQLTAAENEVVALADTLARHHRLVHTRNLAFGFLLVLGVGMGVFGYKGLRAKSELDK